ncbi:MAG: DUF4388 domain-containing protein [Thermoanaerobaculia bacterium]
MALRGTLRDFSLGEILQLIGYQRKTGVLTVEGEQDTVLVSFVDGRVVAADSVQRAFENRVGSLLVRAGKITPEVLALALDEQRRTRQRLGSALLARRAISADDLRTALRTQILNLIYRLFRWKDGRYFFSQESSVDYDADHFTPVATENILMEAARMSDEWPLIEARIPSTDLVFRRAPGTESLSLVAADGSPGPGELLVSREEAIVWKLADGVRTVAEITEMTFLSDFDVVKAMDQLIGRQLLAPVLRVPATTTGAERIVASTVGEPAHFVPATVLGIALLALGVFSAVFMPKNPANALARATRPGGFLAPLQNSISVSRLQRVDRGIELYYLSRGVYPPTLSALNAVAILEDYSLPKGDFGDYRYILRSGDGKYDLYGKTSRGILDPNLSLSRSLDPVSDDLTLVKHKKNNDVDPNSHIGIDIVR